MMGHQRDLLAALGIDIWIPKGAVCQPHQPAVWRDQILPEHAEPVSEIILPATPVQVPPLLEVPAAPAEIVRQHSVQAPEIKAQPQPAAENVTPALQVEAFTLEAVSLPHCVLVINASVLSAEQQRLWTNIQRAMRAEFYSLQWPFAWLSMQDGRGAGAYVQGFIDAFSADKNILCLGDIPHLQSSHAIQLASLQDMLDQPLLKKRLWQFMQNQNREV